MHLDVYTRVGKVTVRGLRDKPGVAADIFSELVKRNIEVLAVSFDAPIGGRADFAFVVWESQVEDARGYLYALLYDFPEVEVFADDGVALLKFTGGDRLQMIADAFNIVASTGANIEMISSGENELLLLIREPMVDSVVEMFKIIYPSSTVLVNGEER